MRKSRADRIRRAVRRVGDAMPARGSFERHIVFYKYDDVWTTLYALSGDITGCDSDRECNTS